MGVNVSRLRRDRPRIARMIGAAAGTRALTAGRTLGGELVRNTPSRTGRLAGSWTLSIGSPAQADTGGPVAAPHLRDQAMGRVPKLAESVYLTNHVPYGPFVNFGTSRMSPRFFVDQTLASFGVPTNYRRQG